MVPSSHRPYATVAAAATTRPGDGPLGSATQDRVEQDGVDPAIGKQP